MPLQRISLATDIETRDGTLSKDALVSNAYLERHRESEDTALIKRPGVGLFIQLPSGNGQGVTNFDKKFFAIVNSRMYQIVDQSTYIEIGSLTKDGFISLDYSQCYFVSTSPILEVV